MNPLPWDVEGNPKTLNGKLCCSSECSSANLESKLNKSIRLTTQYDIEETKDKTRQDKTKYDTKRLKLKEILNFVFLLTNQKEKKQIRALP